MAKVPVSVIIPTVSGSSRLERTLDRIRCCEPQPNEILIHLDGADSEHNDLVAASLPSAKLIYSIKKIGPGGGRNKLIRAATEEIVASFDDDSYPIDPDYFGRLQGLFEEHKKVGVVSAEIIHDGESPPTRSDESTECTRFVGCGCIYRRRAFLETKGYVPLTLAYGMEEVDLALQLADRGWKILCSRNLRVRHETDRSHQSTAAINGAHLQNTALLAFLRYPIAAWPYGALQTFNRLIWSIRKKRYSGLVHGALTMPQHLWKYRGYRNPVKLEVLRQFRMKSQ